MDKFQPSFVLRGMDHAKFWERYWKGEFANRTLPVTEKVSRGTFQMRPSVGSCINDPQFSFCDTRGTKVVCVSTNCSNTRICNWCRRSCEGKERCGIPISIQWNEDGSNEIAWDGYTCSEKCSLAMIRDNMRLPHNFQDPLWVGSEKRLRQISKESHLSPAKDWRLLDINGGSLTEKEYDSDDYQYIRTQNFLPGNRVLYQRL
jgi:hypothetical protein